MWKQTCPSARLSRAAFARRASFFAAPSTALAERLARVVFSAKESVYKLQHPLSGIVLYWRDLEVLLGDGHFNVRFLTACPPFQIGQELIGRWCRSRGRAQPPGLIFTGLELDRAAIKTL